MSEELKVEQVIEIHPDARYVIVLSNASVDKNLNNHVHDFSESITNWWEGDAKFLIMASADGTEIRLEKVSDE